MVSESPIYVPNDICFRKEITLWVVYYQLGEAGTYTGFLGGAKGKEPACQCRRHKRHGFDSWVRKISWRRKCNSLEYSCQENPRDRGAWWATVHRVTKSLTGLKQISMQELHITHHQWNYLHGDIRAGSNNYIYFGLIKHLAEWNGICRMPPKMSRATCR